MNTHETLSISRAVIGPIGTNCYVIQDRRSPGDAVVVDPGGPVAPLVDYFRMNRTTPSMILLTHGHEDHTMGAQDLKDAFPEASIMIAESERRLATDPAYRSGMFGDVRSYQVDRWLKDGDVIELVGHKTKVLFTPGHTEGSSCFYIEDAGILIAGDTLFRESYGRTDLPTGSTRSLMNSLKMLFETLPEDTEVLPGHGPSTTIGYEKQVEGF